MLWQSILHFTTSILIILTPLTSSWCWRARVHNQNLTRIFWFRFHVNFTSRKYFVQDILHDISAHNDKFQSFRYISESLPPASSNTQWNDQHQLEKPAWCHVKCENCQICPKGPPHVRNAGECFAPQPKCDFYLKSRRSWFLIQMYLEAAKVIDLQLAIYIYRFVGQVFPHLTSRRSKMFQNASILETNLHQMMMQNKLGAFVSVAHRCHQCSYDKTPEWKKLLK